MANTGNKEKLYQFRHYPCSSRTTGFPDYINYVVPEKPLFPATANSPVYMAAIAGNRKLPELAATEPQRARRKRRGARVDRHKQKRAGSQIGLIPAA
jgi:hypothetical protein